jgi:6-phosphogluconolactonase (cycloisomerase 2 family)
MSLNKELKWHITAAIAFICLLSSCGGSDSGSSVGGSLAESSRADVTPAYAYVALPGLLTAYSIDPSTGGLTTSGNQPVTFPVAWPFGGITRIAIDPSGRFLYLLHYTGIHAYTIDQNTGALTEVAGSPFNPGSANFLTFDKSGTHLYVASPTSPIAPVNTLISAFSVDSSGALVPLANYTITNELSTLATAGNYLYVAGYYTNSITTFTISLSGELTRDVPGSTIATDIGPYSIAVDASGSVLYTTNDGEPTANEPTPGSVSAFTIDPSTGTLTPVAGNPLPIAAAGPISIDNTGKFLFVPEAAGVAVYAINSASGMLSAVAGSPFSAGAGPVLVTVDPANQFVYVVNRDSENVSEFMLSKTGVLTPQSGSPTSIGGDPCCMSIAWK